MSVTLRNAIIVALVNYLVCLQPYLQFIHGYI